MKQTTLISISVVVILFIAYFSFNSYSKKDNSTPDTKDSNLSLIVQNDVEKEVDNNLSPGLELNNMLVAELVDVTGGDSTGSGTILRNNKLLHQIKANLPDPTGSNVYEGWLVKKQPKLMFISTGVLQKSEKGMYTLIFESDNLYEDYDFVVVTEETVVDKTPEIHIIEGIAR